MEKSMSESLINEANEIYDKAHDLEMDGKKDEAKKEFEKAIKIYEDIASRTGGNGEAEYKLSICYDSGYGVKVNEEKASEYLQKAVNKGNVKALNLMGIDYEAEGNMEKAADCFMKSAEKGYSESQYNLARCYKNGGGIEVNKEKALEYFRLASTAGHKIAAEECNNLLKEMQEDLEKIENRINSQRNVATVLTDKQKNFIKTCEENNVRMVKYALGSNDKSELIEGINGEYKNGKNYLFNLFNKDELTENEKKIAKLLIENGANLIRNEEEEMPIKVKENLKQTIGEKYFEEEKKLSEIIKNYKENELEKSQETRVFTR